MKDEEDPEHGVIGNQAYPVQKIFTSGLPAIRDYATSFPATR